MPSTPLHRAAAAGDYDTCLDLLLNLVESVNERSSLNPAAAQRKFVESTDNHGETARDLALKGIQRVASQRRRAERKALGIGRSCVIRICLRP